MSKLPNGESAIVDIRKLESYCLDSSDPRGRHKARVFRSALGISQNEAEWLRGLLLEAARNAEAIEEDSDSYGARWSLDVLAARHGKQAVIRSISIIQPGRGLPGL